MFFSITLQQPLGLGRYVPMSNMSAAVWHWCTVLYCQNCNALNLGLSLSGLNSETLEGALVLESRVQPKFVLNCGRFTYGVQWSVSRGSVRCVPEFSKLPSVFAALLPAYNT